MLRIVPGTPSRFYDENIRAFVEYKVAQRLLLSSSSHSKLAYAGKRAEIRRPVCIFLPEYSPVFAPRIHHKGRVLTSSCVISFKGGFQSEFAA
jgi:hypothetical protein